MSRRKTIALYLWAVPMILVGITHFTNTGFFLQIVPPYLPWHLALVYLSGVFEILGGVGLLVPQTRKWAAWGLMALLVAVFPANLHMALNDVPIDGQQLHPALLWGRLPVQLVFLRVTYWFTRD
ncbi:MAG: putative membrane protein [Myxococcota bacterium]|jgi:uncharacterized membrane protein